MLWSRVSKEEGWAALPLMRRVLPLSTLVLLCLVPLVDPPGAMGFEWSARRAALVALSGVAAFGVNASGFAVMGACSALTHTVLGQLKAAFIIVGGWVLFGQAYPPRAVGGAALAIGAACAYTRANLRELEARGSRAAAEGGGRPVGAPS